MDFSKVVKHALIEQNLKPTDLARMTGYTPQHIYDLLRGDRRWNEVTMKKACDALGIEIQYITKEKKGGVVV